MLITEITAYLESMFPVSYQESYDNCGLLVGNAHAECLGALVTLDVTERVVQEAVSRNCNLLIAHHPLIFKGLKRITGSTSVERAVITAIKKDVAIYAIHTNLDNVLTGVSGRMSDRLGLTNRIVLQPRPGTLSKLYTFVPQGYEEKLRQAVFAAGAGMIGEYGECSFNVAGYGTFTAGQRTDPFVGERGKPHHENEIKVEIIFPKHLSNAVSRAVKAAHPYEEPAFDLISLDNHHQGVGSGLIGDLEMEMNEADFLAFVRDRFELRQLRYSSGIEKQIKRVALCGGAGSFLISSALGAGADAFLTADVKYHDFFLGEERLLIADIGHFESEQFTVDLLIDLLNQKFSNFALLKTGITTNPVKYFPG